MGQIEKGLNYLKSIPFILKIIEFIVLLIAFALAGHFMNEAVTNFFATFGKKGNIEFFLFATIVGWLIAIVLPILFFIGIQEKVSAIPWTLVVAILSAVWAVLLIIASSLLAAAAKHYEDKEGIRGKSVCELLDDANEDSQCGQLIGGTILGFIATVLYAVDTIIHARMFMTGASSPQAGGAVPA
ncbi:uncharacterized protein LOC114517316 [Dendronephthya gigantea]|uniref:uncharacterized protein LOC114517316 n=1 Tax=Dendronephthya gigantea TaxID=151771 RepID=UPI00106DAF06|nr:uncharacterized protein LOC114517316 [Dendronephthya gigantea]XP_028392801.1 uncharacterized protein LOC114517316 [Dendronephthya gigantea]